MISLSVLDGTPADQAQPMLLPGIHLRWAPGPDRGFPQRGGYYAFRRIRRRLDDQFTCYRAHLTEEELARALALRQLVTPIGTIDRPERAPFEIAPFEPDPKTDKAFPLASIDFLQFSLPLHVGLGNGARLRFRMNTLAKGKTGVVSVRGFIDRTLVFTAHAEGKSLQDVVLLVERAPFNRLEIVQAPALLYEICIGFGSVSPTSAELAREAIPGTGWEKVPSFTQPLTLPLRHPKYLAVKGAEVLQISKGVAFQRIRYQTLATAFPPSVVSTGKGQVTLRPASAIAVGSGGTFWTEETAGMLLLPDGLDTALGIMSVLTPDRLVLTRPYTGTAPVTVSYKLQEPADYSQFYDQIASLFNVQGNTREAVTPPVLAEGGIIDGKRVLVFQGSDQIIGLNADWTAEMAGCLIEIGPSMDLPRVFDQKSIFKIQAISDQLITLDRPYLGPKGTAAYRVFSRSPINEVSGDVPGMEFKPMDLLEMASLDPGYAQALGLYWIDINVERGWAYDYIVLADHEGLFTITGTSGFPSSASIDKALEWLNTAPDFSTSGVDGYVIFDIRHEGANLLPPPQMELLRIPSGGARLTIERPDMADSDVGITIADYLQWPARPVAERPVMVRLWRRSLGPVFNAGTLNGAYDDIGPRLPTSRKNRLAQPKEWPAKPIDIFDTALDVGWYAYRANYVDIFGRFSTRSQPIPWTDSKNNTWQAVHLEDLVPPPAPINVMAWVLDDDDPNLVKDDAYVAWRKKNAGIGLRIKFAWDWSQRNQAPDANEFRLYRQSSPLNARIGEIISVSSEASSPEHSIVELRLQTPDVFAGSYGGAQLQAGNRAFAIESVSSITPLKLRVANGGAKKTERPLPDQTGTVVLPLGHSLHKDLLDPLNWDYLTAIPWATPAAQDVVAMLDAPGDPILVDSPNNNFAGKKAIWNGTEIVLDALPSGKSKADIRPGIDVLALTSMNPPAYQVFAIESIDSTGLKIKPATTSGLKQNVDYSWQIGPADAGIQGLEAVWDDAAKTLKLDGGGDISNIRPDIDMVYVKIAPTTTPADLTAFFHIEQVDLANRRLRLPINTQLTNGKKYAWKIGTPMRLYDIFLPASSADSANDPKVDSWLKATLADAVVYGAIAVSAADKRIEVPDKRTDRLPLRTGNEGMVSAPAAIFRVHRIPPAAPESYNWAGERLYATKAGYDGNSYFTMRWKSPASKQHYRAQVERASDDSLFLTHWKLRPNFPALPSTLPQPILSDYQKLLNALTSAAADATFEDVLEDYSSLEDITLRAFAGLPELEEAYGQVTIDPVPHDAAHEDRLSPDDDEATFVANPAFSLFRDKLDGKARFRYFYRAALVDSAQNRGPLGPPSPPVYLHKVVPPKSPVPAKIRGDERQIELRWVKSREADLAAYRVYRTIDASKAGDIRKMELAQELAVADLDPNQTDASWTDEGVPAGVNFHYRLTALDSENPPNESAPSKVLAGRAIDTLPPIAPEWVSAEWILYDEETGAEQPWPTGGVIPPGFVAASRLALRTDAANCSLYKRVQGALLWDHVVTSNVTGNDELVLYDVESDPVQQLSYRALARNSAGLVSPFSTDEHLPARES